MRQPSIGPRLLAEDSEDNASLETVGVNFATSNGIEADDREALEALPALPAEEIVDLDDGPNGEDLYSGGFVVGGEIIVTPFDEVYSRN